MRYQDGLTVIEALIVLAIVGVLLALGLLYPFRLIEPLSAVLSSVMYVQVNWSGLRRAQLF